MALDSKANNITKDILEKTAPNINKVERIITRVTEGEADLAKEIENENKLELISLKLNMTNHVEVAYEETEDEIKSKTEQEAKKNKNKKPGVRSAARDKVGIDEKFVSNG